MSEYSYLIAAVFLGAAVLVFLYAYISKRDATGENRNSLLDWLLVWPKILDADKEHRNGRFLTSREWLGWSIALAIVVLAIIFT